VRLGLLLIALAAVAAALLAASLAGSDTPAPERSAEPVRCDRYAGPQDEDAAQRLADALRPGQTGCLREGTYADDDGDGYVLRLARGGRAAAPITIRSAPGGRARLEGIVMVVDGADGVRLADLTIVGDGSQNTVKVYAADFTLEESDLTNELRGESCVILGSSDGGRAERPVIRGNTFRDCGSPENENHDHGIYAALVDDAEIVDNVFVNPAANAIQLYPDAQDSYVARNVMDGGPDTIRGGIVIGGDDGSASSGNVVEHNVVAYAAAESIYAYWEDEAGSDNVVRENCTWRSAADDDIPDAEGVEIEGNVEADPQFADPGDGDYRIGEDSGCREVLGG
jgi:hypothetical protein